MPPGVGTYAFEVWTRNAGSGAAYEARKAFGPYTTTRPNALSVTALMPDRDRPTPAGTPVTWTATVAGGTSPYSYKFYVYNWPIE